MIFHVNCLHTSTSVTLASPCQPQLFFVSALSSTVQRPVAIIGRHSREAHLRWASLLVANVYEINASEFMRNKLGVHCIWIRQDCNGPFLSFTLHVQKLYPKQRHPANRTVKRGCFAFITATQDSLCTRGREGNFLLGNEEEKVYLAAPKVEIPRCLAASTCKS